MSLQSPAGKKLRILQLTSSIGFFGAEHMILTLAGALDSMAFESHVASLEKKLHSSSEIVDEALAAGIPARTIPCRGRLDWDAVRGLRALLREERIHVLHCHEPKSRLYGLLASYQTGVPVVTTHHNWTRQDWRTTLVEFADACVVRFCDKAVAVSSLVAEAMRGVLVPASRITVIPNGIDLSHFQPRPPDLALRSALGIPAGLPVVGTVGRLDIVKGHELLIESARSVRDAGEDAAYLVVGEGVERLNLERQAKDSHMGDRIFFAGYQNDVSRHVALMDVFVLPSRREGTPMALLEAMAMEKAVVATPVGGVPDVVTNGENGLLLAERSASLLSAALLRLLTDAPLRSRLAKAAGQCVRDEFSALRMAQRYEKIYRDSLAH